MANKTTTTHLINHCSKDRPREMSVQSVKKIFSKWIVLEPLIVAYCMSMMTGVNVQDIYLDKFKAEDTNATSDDKLQEQTSDFIRNTLSVQTALSVLVLVISGPLSDTHGRKFGILWTVGLTGVAYIVFAILYFLDTHNIYNFGINLYYLPAVIVGISGSQFNFFLTVFSYVGDLSNLMPETRLKRFTFSEASISLGIIPGFFAGSLITEYLGNLYVFLISALLCFAGVLYGSLRLENIIPGKVERNEKKIEEEKTIRERILMTLWLPFKKREGNVRLKVILLCIEFLLQEAPWMLDDVLMVLYSRDKFGWSPETLLDFKAVFWILVNFGQFLCFPFLTKVLALPLMLVGALSSVSRSGYYGLVATCSNSFCLYIAALVNCLAGVQSIIVRSSLATDLPPTELGTIFGMLEIACCMVPLAVAPLASWVYSITIDIYPGAWALVSMAFMVAQFPLFLTLFFSSLFTKQK